jgi:hypothetical protein
MDSYEFDRLTVTVATRVPRRALAAGILAALTGQARISEARKKRKKSRRRRACVPNCTGKACGGDGCGGSCGPCAGNCDNGLCCPGSQRNCGGVCRGCCDDSNCAGGRTCLQGACLCTTPAHLCPDGSCKECCSSGECTAAFPGQAVGCFDGICLCFDSRRPCNGVCCEPEQTCLLSANPRICAEIVSDRNLKTNFASIDPADMLRRVQALPITTWNYTADDPAVRHVGPMAQDFAALFGVGTDDRRIHAVDGQGVTLAAIQGLIAEIEQLRSQNLALAARVASLEADRDLGERHGDG